MGRRRNLRHSLQDFQIRSGMVEIIVADQTAVRFAARRAVFVFIQLFEQRALIPSRAFEFLQTLGDFLLGHVHHADLQRFVRLRIVDQIVQTAPCAFQF